METMLNVEEFVSSWEKHNTSEELRLFLEQSIHLITDETVQRMKARIQELSFSQVQQAVMLSESLKYAAELSQQPLHTVWALIAAGNLANHQGQPQEAIRLYDLAQQQALKVDNTLEAARSQIGKIWALQMLSQYQEAVQVGEAIRLILMDGNEFEAVASVDNNLGNCYLYMAEYGQALVAWQRGIEVLSNLATLNSRGQSAMMKFNMSNMLADQNRYQEALIIATEAAQTQQELGNIIALAVCQTMIGYYNLQLGYFNKALRLMDEARPIFVKNNADNYILVCDLYSIPCYLALNRFDRAVEYAESVKVRFVTKGWDKTQSGGQVNHYLGVALSHLGQHSEALAAFEESRQIFATIGNLTFVANPTLEQAEFHFRRNELEQTETLCHQAATIFQEQGFSVNNARCDLLLGRVRLAQQRLEEATHLATEALTAGQNAQTPMLVYQALLLQAEIAELQNQPNLALECYRASLNAVEEMRGRVAAEARATFVEDKEAAYQGAVALSLELGDWPQALNLVERGKSRGLVELLTGELDVRIKVRAEADRPIIAELENWRVRRNQLVSQLATSHVSSVVLNAVRGTPTLSEAHTESEFVLWQTEVKACEKHMSMLADQLQIRNAAYAEDVVLQPPETRLATEYLEEDTVLIEYYICRGEVLAFVLDHTKVVVVRRLTTEREVNRHLSLLRLNLAGVTHLLGETIEPEAKAERLKQAENNVRALLYKLYRQLIAPLTEHLQGYRHLMIVPHGVMHYLPFHALYNQNNGCYLLEEWEEISYLPSGSLLSFCYKRGQRHPQQRGQGALVMGYSSGGSLAYCLDEARAISELLTKNPAFGQCQLYLEEEAQHQRFEAEAGERQLIHLATHAQFRQDDPLFSALLLAGGELTAQDLFNSELKASLVTFSACETGLGALSGGDELLGLSRACLYAGASSLLLSLWRVEDQSVAELMKTFYSQLLAGKRKGTALRQAQLTLLQTETYRHPFFWAPFILIGHPGLL